MKGGVHISEASGTSGRRGPTACEKGYPETTSIPIVLESLYAAAVVLEITVSALERFSLSFASSLSISY